MGNAGTNRSNRRRSRRGVTLIEVLLVLVILLIGGVLGALFYLTREHLLRIRWPWAHRKHKVVRRRRVR